MSNNTDFMYLMPGNWFEIKNIDIDKVYPFDIDDLKVEITNQINNRNEKLDFININFGSNHGKNIVEEIIFHLDKKKFDLMANILKSEKRHPIITFHGTNLDAVNSILTNGYLIPQLNKGTIVVANGAMYGIGVYTSPFYDKAISYSRAAVANYVYILVNMTFVGTVKMIPPNNAMKMVNFSAPVNGFYSDGSNTRIVYGLEQIISADSSKVFPIAVLKVKIG